MPLRMLVAGAVILALNLLFWGIALAAGAWIVLTVWKMVMK